MKSETEQKNEIGVAVQTWLSLRAELMAWKLSRLERLNGIQCSWIQVPLRPTSYSYFKESFSGEYHIYFYCKRLIVMIEGNIYIPWCPLAIKINVSIFQHKNILVKENIHLFTWWSQKRETLSCKLIVAFSILTWSYIGSITHIEHSPWMTKIY